MKKFTVAAVAAIALSTAPAFAADMVTKGKGVAAAPPPPPAWDIAFGGAIASDYVFRGITQSNHKPAVAAYFEPRYNVNADLQLYVGLGGASISFPNRAAAEVDIYGGFRPTFGKLALDIGAWYYWYPGGQCYHNIAAFGGDCAANGAIPVNGNVIKKDLSFVEVYGKANYNVTDAFAVNGSLYYSPSFLNTGADGLYLSGGAKYTFAAFSNGVTPFISGEFGRQWFGTSDSFYCTQNGAATACGGAFPGGIPYADYNTWNVGFGWTYKVFTVDLRYTDTDLSKGDCNAFTSDHTARGTTNITPINPGGGGSNWCGARFVARLSADLTVNTNIK